MTKIWFPVQRVIRTAVQVILAGAAILSGIAVVAPQILAAIAEVLPGPVVVWLSAFIAGIAAVSMALSRVMAIPAVNEWLKKFGAGSEPKDAVIVIEPDGETIPMTRREYRDYTLHGGPDPV